MITTEDYAAYMSLHTTSIDAIQESEGLDLGLKSLSVVLESALKEQISENDMLWFIDKVS
jgi:hypothetical protein